MLDNLAQLLTEILEAHPRFATNSIAVVNETPPKGLTASDAAAAVAAALEEALQSTGLGIVVRVPTVIDNLSQPTLLPLVQVQAECRENAVLNATGISQSDLALEVAKALHAMPLQPYGGTLELQTIGVEIDNGEVDSHVVTFTALLPAGLNEARVLPVSFSINETTGVVTLTCATAGAAIYYEMRDLTEAPTYPSAVSTSATLYTGPIYPTETQYLYAAAQKAGMLNSPPVRVRVVEATTPAVVTNITSPSATDSTLELEWECDDAEATFEIQVRLASASDWGSPIGGTLESESTSATINDLDYNTSYTVRVRAVGGEWVTLTPVMTSFPTGSPLEVSGAGVGSIYWHLNGPDFSQVGHPEVTLNIVIAGQSDASSLPALIGVVESGQPAQDIAVSMTISNAQREVTLSETVTISDTP